MLLKKFLLMPEFRFTKLPLLFAILVFAGADSVFRGNKSAVYCAKRRVTSESVCAVILAGTFTGSIHMRNICAVILVRKHASHEIMHARIHRYWCPSRIKTEIYKTCIKHLVKIAFNDFRRKMGYIKQHFITSLIFQTELIADPVNTSADNVTRHERAAFRIPLFHKIPLLSVTVRIQPSAEPAGCFRDEHMLAAYRYCRRMKLHHFHIRENDTVSHCKAARASVIHN